MTFTLIEMVIGKLSGTPELHGFKFELNTSLSKSLPTTTCVYSTNSKQIANIMTVIIFDREVKNTQDTVVHNNITNVSHPGYKMLQI